MIGGDWAGLPYFVASAHLLRRVVLLGFCCNTAGPFPYAQRSRVSVRSAMPDDARNLPHRSP